GWGLFGLFAAMIFINVSSGAKSSLLHRERSFFGVERVDKTSDNSFLYLSHGNTLHGMQSLDQSRRNEPLTYYHRTVPMGQVFTALGSSLANQNIAVVGLGIGSLACYAEPGQQWTFYEIDQAVERIARDTRYFTHLRDCEGRGVFLRVVLGDARLRL